MGEWLDWGPSVILGLALLYSLAMVFLAVGMLRLPASFAVPLERLPMVTVIVACRNEERDLPACILGLANLDYPVDKLEVLLVDDESTDRTANIIRDACQRHTHFRALTTTELGDTHLIAKGKGVALAARHATGEWLFITDADGEVAPGWIRHMLSRTDERTGVIGGMPLVFGDSLVGLFEQMSWAFTVPFAFGAAGWGAPFISVGPNMAVRRKVYEEAGGLEKSAFTISEDIALYCMVSEAGYKAVAHASPETLVRLRPVPSMRDLISLQRRHLKGGFEAPWHYGASLTFVFGYHFLLSLALIFGWFLSAKATAIAWLIKIAGDCVLIGVERKRTGVTRLLRFIPVMELYNLVGFLWMPVSFLFTRTVKWVGVDYAIKFAEESDSLRHGR